MDSLLRPGGVVTPTPVMRPERSLLSRTVTALLGGALTVGLILLGQLWLALGVAVAAVIGLCEFYRMAERAGYHPVWEAGIGGTVLFVAAAAYSSSWEPMLVPALLVYTMLVQLRGGRADRALANAGVTVLGALYVGYLFSYLVRLRALPFGPLHVVGPLPPLLVICAVWASESAAYFVGLAWGRRKLLPTISPRKSLEGAAGGIAAGTVAGLLFAVASGLPAAAGIAVGVVCALAAVCGDLWESAIKREVGVKDAGSVLPGHGGILDRFDGLLLAAVAGYAVMAWWPGR
ncbi:MAG TPA: phosphatidate cytidylyltransferase [bacterium]|nr:phosphatidate cytidylyltransferase [bacterium]